MKATPVKLLTTEQVLKKVESGKTVTDVFAEQNRHTFRIEMETDMETIKKVVGYIQEIGKNGGK